VEPIVLNRLASGPVNVLGTTRSTFSGTADAAPSLGEISYAACGAGVKPPAEGP